MALMVPYIQKGKASSGKNGLGVHEAGKYSVFSVQYSVRRAAPPLRCLLPCRPALAPVTLDSYEKPHRISFHIRNSWPDYERRCRRQTPPRRLLQVQGRRRAGGHQKSRDRFRGVEEEDSPDREPGMGHERQQREKGQG